MRNQNDFIDLLDELDQHLTQAKSLIVYMGTDLSENKGFTVTDSVIEGVLWTAQTLITNAQDVADRMSQANKQGGKQ